MSPLNQILQNKIVAILRGVDSRHVVDIANALYAGGVQVLEVTLNSNEALSQIRLLNEISGNKFLIGAGTVLDIHDATAAIQAGAKFLISPTLDVEVIRFTKEKNIVSIPGAYTATEIYLAYKSGADIIKVFPVSTADYIKSLLAPLNDMRLMPTGGINLDNIKEFSHAGAVAFGIGSSLVNSVANVNREYLEKLTNKARNFVQAIQTP